MEVRTEFPRYAAWCMEEAKTGDCSAELQRFVSWLNAAEVTQEELAATKANEKTTAGETARVVKRRGVGIPKEEIEAAQNDEMKNMMAQVIGAIGELSGKVKQLEGKGSNQPHGFEQHRRQMDQSELTWMKPAAASEAGPSSSSQWSEVTMEKDVLNGQAPTLSKS